MSPRRHRRAPQGAEAVDDVRARAGIERREVGPDGTWLVRTIPGGAATKTYRCPGCDQEIRPGTAHVVVWQEDDPSGVEYRRHWHAACWRARATRAPTRRR